jgi:arylsulfatase A-like enzyme
LRARLILTVFLLALPASCFLWKSTPQANVLVISVDSLRFDAISHSLGAAKTPNIQSLASDGVAFSWCFSHSPVTLPSTTALFSSRTPSESRITNDGQGVSDKLPLLPDWLAKQGYQTFASVSLSTLWPPLPEEEQIPQHAEVLPTRGHSVPSKQGIERGFQIYHTNEHELASADEVNASLIPLDSFARPGQPWFIFAQYSDPHEPYESHGTAQNVARVSLGGKPVDSVKISDTDWWKKEVVLAPGVNRVKIASDTEFTVRRFRCNGPAGELSSRYEAASLNEVTKSVVIALENTDSRALTCTLEAWLHDVPSIEEARHRYKLEVESVDEAIGALLDELRAKHEYDNTCIVLTADHGEALGEHGKVGHANELFDELLRVPLIIKPPKGSDGIAVLHKAQHDIIRQIDLAPTILELVDCPPLPGAEGVSLLHPEERVLSAEVHPPEAKASLFAMRDARYKLVLNVAENRFEMYDLNSDTLEVDDVFQLQGHYRTSWQAQLRKLAQNAPQLANVRMGMAPSGAGKGKKAGN